MDSTKHSGTTGASDADLLQDYCADSDFPCTRQDLIENAQANDAPEDFVQKLQRLPERRYKDISEIRQQWRNLGDGSLAGQERGGVPSGASSQVSQGRSGSTVQSGQGGQGYGGHEVGGQKSGQGQGGQTGGQGQGGQTGGQGQGGQTGGQGQGGQKEGYTGSGSTGMRNNPSGRSEGGAKDDKWPSSSKPGTGKKTGDTGSTGMESGRRND